MTGPRFAIIGVAGFVAPRHLAAIQAVGGTVVAAADPHDAVGVLDRYNLDCEFFTDEAEFWRRLQREHVDYVSICSPNSWHCSHALSAWSRSTPAIIEKPAGLRVPEIEHLIFHSTRFPNSFLPILQLRYHPAVYALRARLADAPPSHRFHVEVDYRTPRGRWYDASWKGDPARSGGLLMNIGVHLFDLLLWIFGPAVEAIGTAIEPRRALGHLRLERADVNWNLSIHPAHCPLGKPVRRFVVDGDPFDLSEGMESLHTVAYREILAGRGFGIADALPSIELIERLRG